MRGTATARSAALPVSGLRRVLAVLCLTEITSWGVLYYAFPVLAPDISRDTGWPAAAVTAALSGAQLVSAVAGIGVGRWLDRHGPRVLMTVGSLLAVPAVVLVATAQNLAWFIAAWALAGLAMSATLYPPAFAALTRWHGPRRVPALTTLTLVAGLASTVFAPLTALLAAYLDWRHTYLVLLAILAAVTIPGHWFGLRGPWPPAEPPQHEAAHGDPARIARSSGFRILVTAFSLATFSVFAVVVNLVPLLLERGISPGTAALALGLGGTGQVLGRLGYAALARRTGVRARTAASLAATSLTTVLLSLLTTTVALIAASVVAGMARGVFTLLQATAITDRWGPAHYGRLNGLLSAPMTVTMALAPFAGSALAAAFGSYRPAFLALAAVNLAAAVLALTVTPTRSTP
ncbi:MULTISPECIES: MFS transporter [Amycolatopsis]|uniref:MFS family arabinose efflux permease n=1 Tax=Amycolatopsis echigonensis TaxID=2576905 RepID=A0A2N3WLI0_9PSEU|nr:MULTISPECIES: MFS transporter [Amycolatopsis]MBB2500775.1 MFS transporter [Amycolatopsis echigonensis]MCG3751268.1 MFS transporter [Amycolatopsis sp. Poz14]PKV94733.1 putative MFS family arabinose efflux permease [Amycolatopsis niigatensis]